ncbi:uncharacterized protein LOC107878056 isoform X7 [Capsicum annuum]|uniref:uncharacterized protein LOC107878056 isoform X7 n=1 Tax=Capsicum annuum TaxID=4072 RepID=UPI001FB08157|nr:uncharacterized protein LOC107878056 isoform X7 [Capsicum annuum]
MLLFYTLRSSSSSSLNLVPIEDQVQTFLMEAKISLPNHLQSFFLLTCSNCSHFVCTKTKKLIRCFICKLERLLVRRCHFELDIMDASDTIMVTISKTLGERMFSLTIEQIYERVAVQLQKNDILFSTFASSQSQQVTTTRIGGIACTTTFW